MLMKIPSSFVKTTSVKCIFYVNQYTFCPHTTLSIFLAFLFYRFFNWLLFMMNNNIVLSARLLFVGTLMFGGWVPILISLIDILRFQNLCLLQWLFEWAQTQQGIWFLFRMSHTHFITKYLYTREPQTYVYTNKNNSSVHHNCLKWFPSNGGSFLSLSSILALWNMCFFISDCQIKSISIKTPRCKTSAPPNHFCLFIFIYVISYTWTKVLQSVQ